MGYLGTGPFYAIKEHFDTLSFCFALIDPSRIELPSVMQLNMVFWML